MTKSAFPSHAGSTPVVENFPHRQYSIQHFYYATSTQRRGTASNLLQAWRAGPILALRRARLSEDGVVLWLTEPESRVSDGLQKQFDELFGDIPLRDDEQALVDLRKWLSIHDQPDESEIPWGIISRLRLDPARFIRPPVLHYCKWRDLTPRTHVPETMTLEQLVAEWDE